MKQDCLALAFALLACSSALPRPAATQHPLATYQEVPYPPPAALAETVPARPDRAGVVWLDGEWIYRGSGFVWRRGGWVLTPLSGRFAAWHCFYRRDGRLMLARGTWYDAKHERLRWIEPLVPATTPPNEVTSELQTGR